MAPWLAGQIGSRHEPIAAVKAGCDFIIAQGIEAGGHVRGRIGLLALLNEVLESVEVPVLADGGWDGARWLRCWLPEPMALPGWAHVSWRQRKPGHIPLMRGAHWEQFLAKQSGDVDMNRGVFSANWAMHPSALRSSIEGSTSL